MLRRILNWLMRRVFVPSHSDRLVELKSILAKSPGQLSFPTSRLISAFSSALPERPSRSHPLALLNGRIGLQLRDFFNAFDVLKYNSIEEAGVLDRRELRTAMTNRGEALIIGIMNDDRREYLAVLTHQSDGIGLVDPASWSYEPLFSSFEHLVCFTYCLHKDLTLILAEWEKLTGSETGAQLETPVQKMHDSA